MTKTNVDGFETNREPVLTIDHDLKEDSKLLPERSLSEAVI
jgi:hypothetical protein